MAFTKTQIVNRALVKLGSRPIVDIDLDDTNESNTALNLYDIALETILSETLWTFATKRTLLATLAEEIVFEKETESLPYVYQRPNDVIRIFETNDTAAYFKEEGDTIVSNTAGLGIIYTYRNQNTSTYPPYFARALSDLMASEMAFALLNNRGLSQEILEYYEKISLAKAKSQNAQVGTPKVMNDNYWLNARFGGPNVEEYS